MKNLINRVWNFIKMPHILFLIAFFMACFCFMFLALKYGKLEHIIVDEMVYEIKPEDGFPLFETEIAKFINEKVDINKVVKDCNIKYVYYTKCYNKEYHFSIQKVNFNDAFPPSPPREGQNEESTTEELIPYYSPLHPLNPNNPMNPLNPYNPSSMKF